jgi:Holliday junction resolvase-like predicted endonuclease
MHCRVCNTRLSGGERTCPNCGSDAGHDSSFSSATRPAPLPSSGLSNAEDPGEDVELELDELSGESPAASKPEAPSKPAAPPARPAREPAPKPAATPHSREAPLFAPDAAGLRALLAERPEALEEGLALYRTDDGKPLGPAHRSAVGEIDLIATDTDGALVVVLISEKGGNEGEALVAEVLKRIGWVRKHLGQGKKKVRGVVLCDSAPEDLSYAAAAVSDTVRFKTYRVALAFDDLEV